MDHQFVQLGSYIWDCDWQRHIWHLTHMYQDMDQYISD